MPTPKSKCTTVYDELVGRRIKEKRNQRGMSQEALGHHCGITFQQIQKYEKGTNRVGASRLDQIARALGVSVADLLPPTDLAGEPLPIQDEHQIKAAKLMGEIPWASRSLAIAVLRQFVEG